MAALTALTIEAILENLTVAFREKHVYTNCGELVCALNPCKDLPLYTNEIMDLYRRTTEHAKSLPPHVYATVALAMRQVVGGSSQTILVSGESGSGKTETAKYMLQYMASSGTMSTLRSVKLGSLEDRILESSPVLEAFGNARTAANRNSSRFGKLTKVYFSSRSGRLVGASVECYLLETPRITHLSDTDSNYHVSIVFFLGGDSHQCTRYSTTCWQVLTLHSGTH
jgi:myosin heavy subunit